MDELENMRLQMTALKSRLDCQQIVNQELMRKIMRRKASWLNILVNAEIISIPILFLIIAAACSVFHISQWFSIIYLVMCVVDASIDWHAVRIPPSMFGESSMLEFKKLLLKQKRTRFVQTAVMLPLSIVWVIAFIYSIFVYGSGSYFQEHPDVARLYGIVNAIIGAVVGIVAVLIIYHKMQRTNDILLRDIHDLESQE